MSARRSGSRVSKIVGEVFGLAELRHGQRAVIDAVLGKRHTLAIIYRGRQIAVLSRDQTKWSCAQTALCRTHVLLEALGETVEWSQCETCDNCRGLAIRSEAVAEGAA